MLCPISQFNSLHRQHPKLMLKNLVAAVKEIAHPGFVVVSKKITSAVGHVNVTIKYVKIR